MHRISFNVGNEYFAPVTDSRTMDLAANDEASLRFTHFSFEDEEHLKSEFQRIREKRKQRFATEEHCLDEIEREWSIMKRIKNTYRKVLQKSDEEIDLISRRFVFHVEGQCYAFDLYSSESDFLGHHSTRFWFNDREDLENEWTRIRKKTMKKWPGNSRTKQIRFLEPGWDLEWCIVDGMMKTYLWAENEEETDTETSSAEQTTNSIEVPGEGDELSNDYSKIQIGE